MFEQSGCQLGLPRLTVISAMKNNSIRHHALRLGLALLLAGSAHAANTPTETSTALGSASRVTCGQWLAAREKPDSSVTEPIDDWLRGYFSDFNMLYHQPKHLLSEYEMPNIRSWAARFCAKHPTTTMTSAAFDFFRMYNGIELAALAERKKHPAQKPEQKSCNCQSDKALEDGGMMLVENSNRSCMVWHQKLDAGDTAAQQHFNEYIFGFFSAYNQFADKPAHLFTAADESNLLEAIKAGCAGQPLVHIAKPMLNFIGQLEAHTKKTHALELKQ